MRLSTGIRNLEYGGTGGLPYRFRGAQGADLHKNTNRTAGKGAETMSYPRQFNGIILVHGKPVQQFRHRKGIYTEGRPDTEFTLQAFNNGCRRVKVIVCVNGLNTIGGLDPSKWDSGYIIHPYDSLAIPGWQTDTDTISPFVFEKPSDELRRKMSESRNISTVQFKFFRERSAFIDAPLEDEPLKQALTKHGIMDFAGRKRSPNRVNTVSFEAEDHAAHVITIHFDTAENLRRIGVDTSRPAKRRPNLSISQIRAADRIFETHGSAAL